MTTNQIKETQQYLQDRYDPDLVVDGFWGAVSTTTCQNYLRSLMAKAPASPRQDQASLTKAYGAAGDESQIVNLNVVGYGVKYEGKPVKSIRCNKAVAASLLKVIQELATFAEGRAALADYNGCYENRPMRGGTLPSLHARGAAIDMLAGNNRNKQHWPVSATMSIKVMEVFAKHGWLSAGAFWSRDAMHFERTSLR